MGDRRNIYLTDQLSDYPDVDGIYLYTHWHGTELPELLTRALKAGDGRWDDPVYLARIIVSSVVGQAGDHGSLTGWGLSTRVTHASQDTLVVDLSNQEVYNCDPGGERDPDNWRNPRKFAELAT